MTSPQESQKTAITPTQHITVAQGKYVWYRVRTTLRYRCQQCVRITIESALHEGVEDVDVVTGSVVFTSRLKQVRACCRFTTHKEKACFNVHSQFLASTGRPIYWMSQKRKSNQELDNCQIRIIFGKTREQLLAEAKSEILRNVYRADLAEINTCEFRE